jgi:hypothetical protein
MATTSAFGWETPDDTDLVKDGAAAIRTLGNSIDTSMSELKGGTTGQVLSKTSNTDMDFTWVAQDDSNAIQNSLVDAKGDLIAASANDTPARLAVGNNGETLIADSSTSTGLKWISTYAAINAQTGTTYTLVAADAVKKLVTMSNASAITVTIPPSVFTLGQTIDVQSIGVGLTTFAAGSGVTITSTGATVAAPKLRAQYSACSIICTGTNTFTVIGDLS